MRPLNMTEERKHFLRWQSSLRKLSPLSPDVLDVLNKKPCQLSGRPLLDSRNAFSNVCNPQLHIQVNGNAATQERQRRARRGSVPGGLRSRASGAAQRALAQRSRRASISRRTRCRADRETGRRSGSIGATTSPGLRQQEQLRRATTGNCHGSQPGSRPRFATKFRNGSAGTNASAPRTATRRFVLSSKPAIASAILACPRTSID